MRPELAAAARPGDIFVAGKNFGCGSSREFAPACIAALGVRCIVAKSFARIFYRNGINNGMLLIETDDLYDRCEEGDLLTVEVNRCLKVNGQVIPIQQIPDNLFEIIKAGGLVPRYRALNEAAEAAESVQKEVH
ncbi:MAG: 3-isopropylmalate dehydratase [Angelakisella sp.]